MLDFTRVFAGPYASQFLAGLGAEVIKIERIDGGDEARRYGDLDPGDPYGAPFLAMNRGKRSVALDITTPAGHEVAGRLIGGSDVVIENFRPGVADRLGIGYDQVSAQRPDLVYCSISGFGDEGPLSGRAANDLSLQAQTGLLAMTGEPGRPPVRTPAPLGDIMAGMCAVAGILAALVERASSGRGQYVRTSMLEGQLSMLGYFFADYWWRGTVPAPMGTANKLGAPNQAFPTSDGWVCITSANDRAWQRLCAALGVPAVAADERFATLQARYAHRDELVAILSDATRKMTTAECVGALDAHGVSNAPVRTLAESAADPQVAAMNLTDEVEVPGVGPRRTVRLPIRLSGAPAAPPATAPLLGADTAAVLAEFGYSAAQIDSLESASVIARGGEPAGTPQPQPQQQGSMT